jgi:hypothetical protein
LGDFSLPQLQLRSKTTISWGISGNSQRAVFFGAGMFGRLFIIAARLCHYPLSNTFAEGVLLIQESVADFDRRKVSELAGRRTAEKPGHNPGFSFI